MRYRRNRARFTPEVPALVPRARRTSKGERAVRRSYERPGQGVSEEAALWYALLRGHEFGFIASSDHMATHTSYACIWATARTREALFDGLQVRRTYAATERIALDVRIGEAVMGEQVKVADKTVAVSVRALD